MSLRSRLMLLFGGLLVLLLAAAWWWSHWLTRQLTDELDRVAVSVGRSVVTAVGEEQAFRFRTEGTEGTPKTRVLVERTIQRDDETIHAVHRQEDGMITAMSIQSGSDPARLIELPERQWQSEALGEIEVRAVREDLPRGPHLRLLAHNVSRDIPIPQEGIASTVDRFSRQLFLGLLALVGGGLLLAALISHRVSQPLRELQRAAERIGQGRLGAQARAHGVSEVNATVTAFNSMSRQLAQLDETRRALAAHRHLSEIGEIGRGLAHSLRNPLNAIGLSMEELARRNGDEHSRALAEDVRAQIRRIDESIRGFLTLANDDSSGVEALSVQAILRDVALEQAQQQGPEIPLETRLPEQTLELRAHAAEVRSMVQALVVNAVEASPAGEPVTLSLEPADGGVSIRVVDRGDGIAESLRDRLFQPHATTKPEGSGMGLYLARRLAEDRYRGRLELAWDSSGTTATLFLRDRREDAA